MKADVAQLWRFPLGKGKPELLSIGEAFDIDAVTSSADGRLLAYRVNDEGRGYYRLVDLKTGASIPTPTWPTGVVTSIDLHPNGEQVAVSIDRADTPSEVYTFTLGQSELVRWTTSEIGGLRPDGFASPPFFRYPSFDGLQVPAFVYKPAGDGPHPVVVAIHGGPESQSRPGFNALHQSWVRELGVAVVVPNVRGSTGFGRAYHQADNGLKRKHAVADIGALLDWIATQPDLDASRVVVYGESSGGYMVLASLIDFADRLAGGVDIVSISDFITFLENTRDYRRDLRRAEYGDERDPIMRAFFEPISPLNNASRIAAPLLVIQGVNDPRVPASEAEQIVAAERASGQEAWYLLAMDEGHGFRKQRNRAAMAEAVALYLQRVLALD